MDFVARKRPSLGIWLSVVGAATLLALVWRSSGSGAPTASGVVTVGADGEAGIWDNLPAWLGLLGGGVAFALGRREYANAQKWRRSEFLASEVDKFFGTPKVATALLLIDYNDIKLDADGRLAKPGATEFLRLNDDLMVAALRSHREFVSGTEQFTSEEMLAREAFDELLTRFERFQQHIRNQLVDPSEVKVYLGYWVEKFANPCAGWKGRSFYVAVHHFVATYQYSGAAKLFADFNGIPDIRAMLPELEELSKRPVTP